MGGCVHVGGQKTACGGSLLPSHHVPGCQAGWGAPLPLILLNGPGMGSVDWALVRPGASHGIFYVVSVLISQQSFEWKVRMLTSDLRKAGMP